MKAGERMRMKWPGALLMLVLVELAGCPAKQEGGEDGGSPVVAAPASVEQATQTPVADGGDDGGLADEQPGEGQAQAAGGEEDSLEVDEGEGKTQDGKLVLRATGRARRGVDISLCRDAAAERARAQLLKLMKQKGYLDASSDRLEGATIERYFQRGRYIYAVAAIEVGAAVNQSGTPASKSSEEQGVQRQEPHGGTK